MQYKKLSLWGERSFSRVTYDHNQFIGFVKSFRLASQELAAALSAQLQHSSNFPRLGCKANTLYWWFSVPWKQAVQQGHCSTRLSDKRNQLILPVLPEQRMATAGSLCFPPQKGAQKGRRALPGCESVWISGHTYCSNSAMQEEFPEL